MLTQSGQELIQDLRYALRSFRRSPGFVAAVIATIALGLGLNTTVFTIFNAYMLRPNAIRDPYSVFQMHWIDRVGRTHNWTWDQYRALASARPSAENLAFRYQFARLGDAPMIGMLVSGEASRVLGLTVELGRPLLPEDAALPDGSAVIVIGYDAWRSRFGSDSGIIGQRVHLRGYPVTVVGVLSRRFQGLSGVPPDFLAPITLAGRLGDSETLGRTATERLDIVIRLRPGESASQARAALGTWAARVTRFSHDSMHATGVELLSLSTPLPRELPAIWGVVAPIMVAFALVMLIACANVANMMLARALGRQREIGIRLALGAGRARLVRQLLTESALLAVPAALIGFLISRWTIDAGVRAMFASIPADFAKYLRVLPLLPDVRVFLFIVIAAVAAALLFGLVPALQATRPSIVQASRGDFDTSLRPNRLRALLLLGQVTVCALLLITTGVLLRAADRARRMETGLRTGNVVQLSIDDRARDRAVAKLKAHSLVRDLAGSASSPLDAMFPSISMMTGDDRRVEQTTYNFVSSSYFSLLGIPITAGRGFTVDEERGASGVAVVNRAFADRVWSGRDPLGQLVRIAVDVPAESRLGHVRTARVVGVARNSVSGWIGTGLERPIIYFPSSAESPAMHLLALVRGDETQARMQLDRDMRDASVGPAVEEIHTLNDLLAVQVYPFAALSWIAAALGGIALLLTIAGTYGVLSYLVRQRTKEIGIRMALGASIYNVVRMVLRQTLVLGATGTAIALMLALALSRVFSSVFVIVRTFDALAYAVGAAAVLAATVVASYAPAARAARVNPLDALRHE